jgi:capsular polysaccharide biosynthesis protein
VTADPPTRVYRRASLPELAQLGVAEAAPYLPESRTDVPALTFGDTDLSRPGIVEKPPHGAGAGELHRSFVTAYLLHDAQVHGRFGIVTCGDLLVAESVLHLPPHRLPGAAWLDEARLRLPVWPPSAALPAAFHLLAAFADNYFHWILDGLSRFDAGVLRGIGVFGQPGRQFRLLVSDPNTYWKRQSLDLLLPPDIEPLALRDGQSVQVERLAYIPDYAGGGWWHPHSAVLGVFDRMRAAAYASHAVPAEPWRRLFVSRADSDNRVLANEAELADLAGRAGFETVVLGQLSVPEQIRRFAEATHVMAPHGAGLTNLAFCRPGATVCELQMNAYVHWAFRGLAALRRLRYGCLIGETVGTPQPYVHANRWRLDPAAVAAVLADPRF